MMKYFLLFLLIVSTSICSADNTYKVLTLKQTVESINIDGVIDPAWTRADSVSDFVQYRPYHGVDPSTKTMAKVLTTEDALYCILICYEDKKNIQQKKGKLDDFGGDVVSIMLDTFGNKRTAYKFAVTATGVRADSKMLDDARNRDTELFQCGF